MDTWQCNMRAIYTGAEELLFAKLEMIENKCKEIRKHCHDKCALYGDENIGPVLPSSLAAQAAKQEEVDKTVKSLKTIIQDL